MLKLVSVWVVAVVVVGCLKPNTKQCGDFTCGQNSVCSPGGDRCVDPRSLEACQGFEDGAGCSYVGLSGTGVCQDQVCVFGGCGNTIVETMQDEVCDDGNNISGDGCRADCKSREVCGDGVIDVAVGEVCDCGNDTANVNPDCNGVNSDNPGATCRADCKDRSHCGDAIVDPGEVCDDGNNVPGDGCRADCQGRWTRMNTPTLANFRSVWASSPTDVWVAGINHVMRYDGTTWSEMKPPGPGNRTYTHVWGISSQEVFVIESSGPTAYSTVWRWTGANNVWTAVTPGSQYRWSAIHGVGDNVWVIGRLDYSAGAGFGASAAAHWDAVAKLFTNQNIEGTGANYSSNNNYNPYDIAVTSDGNVYFSGENENIFKRQSAGNWSFTGEQGRYLVAPSTTDITAFSESRGAIHYANATTGWVSIADTSNVLPVQGVHGVAGTTLVVGTGGHMLICSTNACTPSQTGVTDDLYDAFVFDAKHAFVVGDFGTVLY